MKNNTSPAAPQTLYGAAPQHQASPTEVLTFQALMEIKQSIGELKSDIKSLDAKNTVLHDSITNTKAELKDSFTELETKVGKIESTLTFLKGAKWSATKIIIITVSITTFILTTTFYIMRINGENTKITLPSIKNSLQKTP